MKWNWQLMAVDSPEKNWHTVLCWVRTAWFFFGSLPHCHRVRFIFNLHPWRMTLSCTFPPPRSPSWNPSRNVVPDHSVPRIRTSCRCFLWFSLSPAKRRSCLWWQCLCLFNNGSNLNLALSLDMHQCSGICSAISRQRQQSFSWSSSLNYFWAS